MGHWDDTKYHVVNVNVGGERKHRNYETTFYWIIVVRNKRASVKYLHLQYLLDVQSRVQSSPGRWTSDTWGTVWSVCNCAAPVYPTSHWLARHHSLLPPWWRRDESKICILYPPAHSQAPSSGCFLQGTAATRATFSLQTWTEVCRRRPHQYLNSGQHHHQWDVGL